MYIKVQNISKEYTVGEIKIDALKNVTFNVDQGEFIIIVGASGAGKTTLLNILGGMDQATSGDFFLDEINIGKLSENELTMYRRNDIGFVFQFYNLIPNLTAMENVEMATQIVSDAQDAEEVLKSVGLENRKFNFPSQLSGGEQQRVSIARALAKNPKILLCDEPTGALDYETGRQILNLLQSVKTEQNKTIIMITHNALLAPMADKVITMKNGEIASIVKNSTPKLVEEIEW